VQWPGDRGPPSDRALFFSRLYHALGLTLAAQGNYGHATVLLQRDAAHAVPPASEAACRASRPLRLALAGVLLEQGRIAEAERVLEPLGDGLDPRTDPGWHVRWLELTGQCHLLRGKYGAALARLVQVND